MRYNGELNIEEIFGEFTAVCTDRANEIGERLFVKNIEIISIQKKLN